VASCTPGLLRSGILEKTLAAVASSGRGGTEPEAWSPRMKRAPRLRPPSMPTRKAPEGLGAEAGKPESMGCLESFLSSPVMAASYSGGEQGPSTMGWLSHTFPRINALQKIVQNMVLTMGCT
jgi:hypothetical protein